MQTKRSLLVLVFLAGAFVGSRFGAAQATPAPDSAPAHVAVDAPSALAPDAGAGFDPISSAPPTAAACDETARMMVAMFDALANQALANAGKRSDQVNAAVAGDREAFISYLAALGMAPDDPRVAAMLRVAFPTASELPEITPGC